MLMAGHRSSAETLRFRKVSVVWFRELEHKDLADQNFTAFLAHVGTALGNNDVINLNETSLP